MWPYLVAGGLAAVSTALGVREARKNREWQERMSSTAHQREVADRRKAGIHPMVGAGGGGASTPSGNVAGFEEVARSGSSAMALKQAQANILLTRASTVKALEEAAYTRTQSQQVGTGGVVFKQRELDLELSRLSLAERRNLFAPTIAKAYAEVAQIGSATRAANARATLDEFAKRGAMNAADVEELIAKYPEFTRLFGPVVGKLLTGGVAGAAAGALLRKPVKITNIRR